MNNAFLITAYKQLEQTRQNIQNIRCNFKHLKNDTIIVITTAEEDIGFSCLQNEFDDVIVYKYRDAPGSPQCNWFTPKLLPQGNEGGGPWRFKYLTACIMTSIEKGLKLAEIIDVDSVIHSHSDTKLKASYESTFIEEINDLINNNRLWIGDCAEQFEDANRLPPKFNFCPEGIIFNVKESCRTNFINMHDMYNDENFHSIDWVGIEATMPSWAHYKLTGKNVDRDNYDPIFYKKVLCRKIRHFHGDWEHLSNPPGYQQR